MADELTVEQLLEINNIFEVYRCNEKDYILKKNLIPALSDLNLNFKNETEEEELIESISEYDYITLSTFVKITADIFKKLEFSIQLEDAFKAYSAGDIKISYGKLKESLTHKGARIKDEEATELLKNLTFDDEYFNYKEFIDKEI